MSPARAPLAVTVTDLQSRVALDPAAVRRIAGTVARGERKGAGGRADVCFVTDRRMRRLNRTFHKRDCATDVLSFDLGEEGRMSAEVVISTDTAASNAKRFGTSPLYESYLYVIHGMLHLTGYDDGTARERASMRRREEHYLKALKIEPR